MRTRVFAFKILSALIPALALVPAGGCRNGDTGRPQWEQVRELQTERTELRLQVEELQAQNEQLAQQVDALAALQREVRLEALYTVKAIELSRRTGLFDKDNDGTKESLIVYLRIIDEAGDAVKNTGEVEVQLWDLNAPEAEALLGKWQVTPDELTRLWASTIMTSYYRLTFNVADINPAGRGELTVRVTFTDYLTGKVLRQQTVIKP